MIDFHNHILPSTDDGPSSINMSVSMLQHAQEQGITDVVNTVHFKHPKMEGKEVSFEVVRGRLDNLNELLEKSNI